MDKIELKIDGMHCVSCERTIENALNKVPGVEEVKVSFVANHAYIKGAASPHDLINAVQSTGYNAILAREEPQDAFKHELLIVICSALLTLPLLVHMLVPFLPPFVQWVLASVVQFGFGWRFCVGSYWALRTLTGNMDLLICLGTSAAYFFSTVVYFFGLNEPLYFESGATIITLVLLGRFFETRSKVRASLAIRSLLTLQPKQALVKRGEEWREILIEEIKVGDLFQVRPGEKIPIDAEVVEGESFVDESLLTGESLPLAKTEGKPLFGGTQNQRGALIGRATAVGDATALASLIKRVQEAQSSRAPIQKLADQISAIFVPVVVAISLFTWGLWWILAAQFTEGLINAVAVLVVACPCALGMATPMVIMVAAGKGAKAGILVKNAEALQRAEKLTLIALDKTGTLTEGKPALTDVLPDHFEFKQIAASLEAKTEHPIGQTIADLTPHLPVTRFETLPGKGVRGEIEGTLYYAGSLGWMEELGHPVNQELLSPLEKAGKTLVALSDETKVLCYFAVADRLRYHSKEGVDHLKRLGLKVVMLTGDRPQTAEAIAHEAGIASYYAQLLPEQKADRIEQLRRAGEKVGMVGDGMNDAPALAVADVGIALSTGTDIAMESADITLMKSDLRDVAASISLSLATFRKVRQNLFFAFIYNVVGIPLAACGLLNPMIAGALMALSSLSVVSNSLLLNRWKP